MTESNNDREVVPQESILLALGELASIQIELIKIIERPARSGPMDGVQMNSLHQRARGVLQWIAERTGL